MLSVATTLFGILFGLLAGGVWIGISLAITGTLMRWDRSGNWIPKSQVFLLNSSAQWRMLPAVAAGGGARAVHSPFSFRNLGRSRIANLRLKARRGPKKAVLAVAASILTTAYHKLADTPYPRASTP